MQQIKQNYSFYNVSLQKKHGLLVVIKRTRKQKAN